MTGQIDDQCKYDGREFSVAGIEGRGLFNPAALGMSTVPLHTACWRGFYCLYQIEDGRLYLEELTLRTHEDRYVPIDGVLPAPDEYGRYIYRALRHPVDFSGKLLLAAGFIEELYVHMGFQGPSSYETVIELTLEQGLVTASRDRSEEMAAVRQAFKAGGQSGITDIAEWIAKSFERGIPPPEPPKE